MGLRDPVVLGGGQGRRLEDQVGADLGGGVGGADQTRRGRHRGTHQTRRQDSTGPCLKGQLCNYSAYSTLSYSKTEQYMFITDMLRLKRWLRG